MRFAFGDMTKKVNVFSPGKQPHDVDNQKFEVNLTENLTIQHNQELELEAECEFELESEDFNLNQIVDSAMNWASIPISLNLKPTNLTSPSILSLPQN